MTSTALKALPLFAALTLAGGCDYTVAEPPAPADHTQAQAAPLPDTAVFTITANGIHPKSAQVAAGATVVFNNEDTSTHRIASDPHATHADCAELNGSTLPPGAAFIATMRASAKSCGFHDELQLGREEFTGTVQVGAAAVR